MSRSTALESHLYRDPMEILSAKQERERKPGQSSKRELPVRNTPLLDFPRREPEGMSDARKSAESLFSLGDAVEEKAWSPARKAAEALFSRDEP